MKRLFQTTSIRVFMAAVFLMGVVRFALTVSGLPDSFVKYFSMTAVSVVGVLFLGVNIESHKDRFKAAYLLVFPYMVVEVLALGYTWYSGRQTIFHSADYSFGTPIALHTLGHLAGGLLWEPWMVFVLMEIVWFAAAGTRRILNFHAP